MPRMCSAYLVLSARTQALWPLPARREFFSSYNLCFPMGGMNGLWATSPGLSVTSTREVKGQVKGQGSVAYTL